MRLRRAKETPRRRLPAQPNSSVSSFSYRARRIDSEANTGRRLDRSQLQARAQHMARFWLQRFGLAVLLIVAIVCVVSVLSLSTTANIELPSSSATQSWLRAPSVYQAAANQILASSLWNRNKITINTAHISKEMAARFPELAGANVALPLIGHRPIVYVRPATAALILTGQSGSYVIADTGRAILAITPNQPLAKSGLPVVTDQSGLAIGVGRQVLPSSTVRFVQVIVTELTAKHFTPTTMTLPAAASELDVHLANQPYFVKFNLYSNDPRQQAGTFLATITHLQGENITPAQYVDVRVDGRSYYK